MTAFQGLMATDPFQSTPALCKRENALADYIASARTVFQSTPALCKRENTLFAEFSRKPFCFNPLPLYASGRTSVRIRRFARRDVSIHSRFMQAGEHLKVRPRHWRMFVSIHSRFMQAGERSSTSASASIVTFQSTPALCKRENPGSVSSTTQ